MANQLKAIPLVTPGFKGLNKTQSSVPDLDPGWATTFQNFIFDQSGRIQCRMGWTQQTVTPIAGSPAITAMAELTLANGTNFVVSAANNKLYTGTTVLTDITGSLTITANNWQFFSFNGALYGVQANHPLIKWTGSGSFATITPSTGTVPSGGVAGMAAFGRLWIVGSDFQTIFYCDLLSDVNWGTVGAGSINLATVWTRGIDQITAVAAAGAKLVVLGQKQIIVYYDQTNPAIGLNPANLAVYDTIEGTGCVSRDTVVSTGEGDLHYLSPTGVQSLGRLLISGKDNPVKPLDPQVRDYFNGYFVNEDPYAVRAIYSSLNRFYMILLPLSGEVFVYDTRFPMQDGSMRVAEWSGITFSSMVARKNGDLLLGQAGVIGLYSGFTDNGTAYQINYASPYLAMAPDYENEKKVMKRMKAVIYYGSAANVTFQWGVDFQGLTNSYVLALTGTLSEYGSAQYNNIPALGGTVLYEYGGGAGLTIVSFPTSLSGRWLQFGMTATINGFQLALAQLDAFVKVGVMD